MFIQDEFSITNALTLNAGGRYDYFSIFGSTVNQRVGLIYNPYQNSTVKLLYGAAFRALIPYEQNFAGAGIVASSGLKPENLKTVELILEHYFTWQLRAEVNLFHTDLKNIIYLTRLGNGEQQYQNIDNIDSNGLELQLEQHFDYGLQGHISYSWQENRDKVSHQRLINSPEYMVKLNLIAPLWADKVFAGYELQYLNSRKTPKAGGQVGDYVISNLTIFTQNWIKGLDPAGLYNLFDERYFDPASDALRQNAIQQDGLTFRIKTSVDF
jgi:iron complex outermembrane receptor protein